MKISIIKRVKKQKGLSPIAIVVIIAVLIGGYLLYQNQAKLPSASQQTTQPSTNDETTNWKTYTNTKFEYSFKYPDNWYIKNITSESNLTDVLDHQILNDQQINSLEDRKISVSYAPYLFEKAKSQLNSGDGGFSSKSDILESTLQGHSIVKAVVTSNEYNWQNSQNIETGKSYRILISMDAEHTLFIDSSLDYKDTVNQILSTFKFLDQNTTDISDWKTYTDKAFNFSFRYPSNWKIDKIPDDTLGMYINFFEEGATQMTTTNMHTRGNEVFRIMFYGDETIFNNLKGVKPVSPASITVSGKPALKSESQVDILVNNKVLHLEIISDESKKYIDQILSTVKFTQ